MSTSTKTSRITTQAIAQAKAKWGTGWSMLSEEQRKGAVALAFVGIVAGQEAVEGCEESQLSRVLAAAEEVNNF